MNDQNIKPHEFKEGQSGNPSGKPPGTKNRSTIARKVLEMRALFAGNTFEQLQLLYPDIAKTMTVEEIGNIIQAHKMCAEGDTNAYKALMDSAYGAPKQEIDQTVNGQINIINLGSGIPPNETITEAGERDLLSEG